MAAAARVGDLTEHPGIIAGPGVLTVLIGGAPAAVLGDKHICALPPLAGPHPASTIVEGSKTVLIGGSPAARVGDMSGCGAAIVVGSVNVSIGD